MQTWKAGINSLSEKKEAAELFLTFIDKQHEKIAQAAGAVTITGIAANSRPLTQKVRQLYEGSDILRDDEIFEDLPLAALVLQTEISKMWQGSQTAAETAQAVKNQLNPPAAGSKI